MSNDVFFLGSGFSKAIDSNYETLEGLSSQIVQNLKCEKESIKSHLINEVPKQYKKDIELLLTYLQTKLPYKTKIQIATDEALYMSITDNIASHFLNKENNINYFNNTNIKILIKYICDKKLTCLTLNYDLLLENLITDFLSSSKYFDEKKESINLYKMPILSILSRTDGAVWGDDVKPSDLPTVLKLHGSINWFYNGVTQSDTVFCKPNAIKEDDYIKQLIELGSVDLQHMIIPPVLDKTSSYGHILIQTIWKEAYKKLQEADKIYIYGFSFPPTDLSVRYLFQSALSNNDKHPKIFVINTSDALKKESECYLENRFKGIFEGYNLNFDYCCENSLERFVQEVIKPKLEVANAN